MAFIPTTRIEGVCALCRHPLSARSGAAIADLFAEHERYRTGEGDPGHTEFVFRVSATVELR